MSSGSRNVVQRYFIQVVEKDGVPRYLRRRPVLGSIPGKLVDELTDDWTLATGYPHPSDAHRVMERFKNREEALFVLGASILVVDSRGFDPDLH